VVEDVLEPHPAITSPAAAIAIHAVTRCRI
jgi:hypothetical protein